MTLRRAVKVLTPLLAIFGAPLSSEAADSGVVIRRLDETQYRQIIVDVFGPGINVGGRFEPVPRQDGLLAVGTGKVGLTASGFEQYDTMARTIAAQVVDADHRAVLIPCKPAAETDADEACVRQFLGAAGRLLYRRPLTAHEMSLQLGIAAKAAHELKSFYAGLQVSLAAMLVAPQFIFRQETLEPDPAHPGQMRLDAYAKAQRLSFLFWNAAPDPELLDAAASGKLHTDKGLAQQVDRLMASPRLEAGVRAFFSDMLGFDEFASLAKDVTLYPKYSSYVSADAQEQTLRTIVDLLLTGHGDYRDIFTTRKTFLTPLLGSVYGVQVVQNKPNGYPGMWIAHEYPQGDPRVGILTHVSFVALHSHPGRTSPTIRGKAIRELILCQKVPPPPGNVEFKIVQDTTNPTYKTARDRLKAHAGQAMCAGCHKITDPVGLALENFDSAGGYRTQENGAVLDTSGTLNDASYTDAAGLGKAVHDDPAATQCLVKRLSSYALGKTAETDWTAALETGFAADGYRLPELMKRIAVAPAFTRVNASTATPNVPLQ